ncbi:hypothetical protein Tco_0986912 [Tanacetum coccineum]
MANLNTYPSRHFNYFFYADDDDDEEYAIAITPDSPKMDSLIMVDKHLDTISEMESDEFIKSSVENPVQNPSESDDESECDLPIFDDFTTFSNPLFDFDDDLSSSNDESLSDEDVSKEIYSNPLFEEEIISTKIDSHHFNAESDLVESLLNHDTLIISSPKFDFLLEEFSGELVHIDLIPLGINEMDFVPEEDIHFVERLEEIDIFSGQDESIPLGLESNDYDSEGDYNSISLPEFESFHVDYPESEDSTIDVGVDILVDVPNFFPTHPTLHKDFDFIPSHNDLGSDLDVSSPSGDRHKIYDPRIYIEVKSTRFLATLSPVIDTLLPFSSKNEEKVFNHGVLASKEKSPPSSHRGFKTSNLFHHKSLMMIYGEDIPILDVPYRHFYPP